MAKPPANPRAVIGGNQPPSTAEILKDKHKDLFERASKLLPKLKKAVADLDKPDGGPKTEADCAKLEDLFGEARDLFNDSERKREAEKEPHLKAGREIDEAFHGSFRDALGPDPKKPGLARRLLDAAATRRLAITRAEQQRQEEAAERARKEADKLAAQQARQEEAGQVKQADITGAKVEGLDRQADQLEAMAAAPVSEASRSVTTSGRSTSVNAVLNCTGVVRDQLDLEALRPYFKQDDLVAAVNAALKMGAFKTLKGASIVEKAQGRVR